MNVKHVRRRTRTSTPPSSSCDTQAVRLQVPRDSTATRPRPSSLVEVPSRTTQLNNSADDEGRRLRAAGWARRRVPEQPDPLAEPHGPPPRAGRAGASKCARRKPPHAPPYASAAALLTPPPLARQRELDLGVSEDPFSHSAADSHAHHSHAHHSHAHDGAEMELHVPMTVPKVGVAMPEKRPDWFRVPAPSGDHSKFNVSRHSSDAPLSPPPSPPPPPLPLPTTAADAHRCCRYCCPPLPPLPTAAAATAAARRYPSAAASVGTSTPSPPLS